MALSSCCRTRSARCVALLLRLRGPVWHRCRTRKDGVLSACLLISSGSNATCTDVLSLLGALEATAAPPLG